MGKILPLLLKLRQPETYFEIINQESALISIFEDPDSGCYGLTKEQVQEAISPYSSTPSKYQEHLHRTNLEPIDYLRTGTPSAIPTATSNPTLRTSDYSSDSHH